MVSVKIAFSTITSESLVLVRDMGPGLFFYDRTKPDVVYARIPGGVLMFRTASGFGYPSYHSLESCQPDLRYTILPDSFRLTLGGE